METTVKCPICGEPYAVYDLYAFDQSACPGCRRRGRAGRKERRMPASPRLTPALQPKRPGLADELAKLGALRDSGMLSEEEFAAAKTKLLGI